jgi:hypothetical protein
MAEDIATKYPEHAKQRHVIEKSQTIGDFLSWMASHKLIHRMVWDGDGNWVHAPYSINELLADYFGIDLKKIDEEKDRMLEEIRNMNQDS